LRYGEQFDFFMKYVSKLMKTIGINKNDVEHKDSNGVVSYNKEKV